MKRFCRFVSPFLVPVLLLCPSIIQAQMPQSRLSGVIAEESRAALAGSRSPHAQRGQDLGAVSPEMAVPGITLVFKRSSAQQSALDGLLAAQQNPASPLFHQWLTPDAFASRFGTAPADIAATETWLQAHGFHIDNAGRDRITFSGTAAQVQSAFGAELHHYQVDGERHFAPATDLMLPAELAPMTSAVLHLSDFRPKPSVVAQTQLLPQFTSPATQAHYLTPPDLFTLYNINGQRLNGGGQSIAVVGQSYVNTGYSSEIRSFQSIGSTNSLYLPLAVLVPGSGVEAVSPGNQGESEIDLEYASGIAPSASIFLVYVGVNSNYSVFDSLDFAITTNMASIVSISYSVCESLLSATELNQDNALFQQAAAQGQTLVAASGDSGSTACAPYLSSSGVTPLQQQALAVSFPASSPYVIAVGGTQMAAGTYTAGSSPYWSSTSSNDSLLSYLPEVAWNEGSATLGIIAGGGGVSGYFPRPAWQTGVPGISSGAYRLLPDVALQSSLNAPGFLICTSDRSLSGSQTSCTSGLLGSSGQYTVAGGTSFAAPVFAGMIALLNQAEQTTGQGDIHLALYALASNPTTYASVFHDITSGTIACVAGANNCAPSGQSGYAATPGYDEATGLGSFDFGKLIADWPASPTLSRSGTSLSMGNVASTALADSLLSALITVNPTVPTTGIGPSGTVTISLDGTVIQSSTALVATSAAPSFVAYDFKVPATPGSHIVTATYSGDAKYAPSNGSASVLVGNVAPSGSFNLAANNLGIVNGSTGTDSITITPVSGYSGRITWSLNISNASSGAPALSACYRVGSPAVNGPSTATLTIGVGSACAATSAAAQGSAGMLMLRAASGGGEHAPWNRLPATTVCAGLLLAGSFLGRKQRIRLPVLLSVIFLILLSTGLSGCGGGSGGSGSSPTPTPTPVSTPAYTMTLTGTDSVNSAIASSTTFTLTVN